MLILLPPSEGKTAPSTGDPLEPSRLVFPDLAADRDRVLDSLIAVSGAPEAIETLKVSPGLADVVAANTGLRSAPTAPAAQVYTGVLYDALDLGSLTPARRARAADRLLIFSALFGVLRPGDPIPAYRLSGSVRLPQTGTAAAFWRPRLTPLLDEVRTGLVIDCRSASYGGMWQPSGALSVRVFHEAAGKRTVVTHMAKHARGLIARALCHSAADPATPAALVRQLNAYFADRPTRTATGIEVALRVEHSPGALDVITSER